MGSGDWRKDFLAVVETRSDKSRCIDTVSRCNQVINIIEVTSNGRRCLGPCDVYPGEGMLSIIFKGDNLRLWVSCLGVCEEFPLEYDDVSTFGFYNKYASESLVSIGKQWVPTQHYPTPIGRVIVGLLPKTGIRYDEKSVQTIEKQDSVVNQTKKSSQ